MNWKTRLFYPLILLAVFTACDSFEEDMEPEGEEQFALREEAISVLAGSSLFIDLKKSIHTSGAVKFGIETFPAKGTAEIRTQAILVYRPNQNLAEGTDFLSVSMMDSQDDVLDTDTIFIHVVSSTDSIPCSNGAMSDYFVTRANQVGYLDLLHNDAICTDEVAEKCVTFSTQPEHGQLQESDTSFIYQFTPESDYVGMDQFLYELKVVDLDGNEHFSMAEVKIEILEATQVSCDSLVYPFYYELEKPLDEFYDFEAFKPHPLCEVFSWAIDSLQVQSGSAEITAGGMIRYYSGPALVDRIDYVINFGDGGVPNYISIVVEGSDDISCPEAYDDEFYVHIIQDSVGTATFPYSLSPVNNDAHCTEEFSIRILEGPDVGVASVAGGQAIEYYVEEEFAGIRNTSLYYELCDLGTCDSAYVFLTVEQ